MPRFEMEKMEGWQPGTLQLAASDCEPLLLRELLELADDDSRQRWEELSLGYPSSSAGEPALLAEIADGIYSGALRPDQVLGVIPAEGILLAMHSIGLEPGDHVVSMAPGYASLSSVASHALDAGKGHLVSMVLPASVLNATLTDSVPEGSVVELQARVVGVNVYAASGKLEEVTGS